MSCVHDRSEVDAGSLAEKAPEMARKEHEHCLAGQQQRHPLVVADLGGGLVQPAAGDRPLDRQVVGVADPADGVRVVAVTLGELGGTPAADRRADELLGGDEEGEADENGDRVEAAQPVGVVVVGVWLQLAHAERRLEQPIHRTPAAAVVPRRNRN